MAKGVVGIILLGAFLCVSCGSTKSPALKPGITVVGSDLRIGLTAEDQMGAPAQMNGDGFQGLTANSHVFSSAEEIGSGILDDGGNAWAAGMPESVWTLRGQVFAKPSPAGAGSDAQVVELAVSDLIVDRKLPNSRLVVETELRADIGMNAVSLCKVEAELTYDGALVGKIEAIYYLYGVDGGRQVEIYRGRRGKPGSERMAVVGSDATHVLTDPSFYFDLGPGEHELVFSMSTHAASARVASPGTGDVSGTASLRAEVRLRVE